MILVPEPTSGVSCPVVASGAHAMSGTSRRAAVWMVLALVSGAPAGVTQAQEPFDLLIRGGRLLDGSGNPWRFADVGVRGDRVTAVGDLTGAPATRVIEARGRYVSPGFIDVHSHAAEGLTTASLSGAHPILAQGITTVLVNPDGGGPVDLAAQRRSFTHGLGLNVALLVGHAAVRRAVLGMSDRAPTAAELERMKALVRAGMEAGAFGLSSGPYYAPGSFSKTDELVELARVIAPYGGTYTSHVRDEADYTVGVVAAVDEVIQVAREAGIRGVVSHIKALGPHVWGYSMALAQRIERARSEGVEVFADQYPYEASATGLGASLLPRWAEAGGRDSLLRRLNDPTVRGRLVADMLANLDRRGGADRLQFRRYPADPSIEGTTLASVAAARGQSAVDAAIELIKGGEAGVVSFNMHPDDVRFLMRQPWVMTCTDGDLVPMGEGVPHPRSYGAFPRKLRKYVVEEGLLDLGDAIRSMTSLPAAVFRLQDRGTIREGAVADLLVFDLERVRDVSTFQQPHQLADGMAYVVVNGQVAIDDARATGVKAGRVLSLRDDR
jgi:N-acyl-D-aspartate/D-glutamate deacylase